MALIDTLLELEDEGWRALSASTGAAFYGDAMADDGLMVLPGMVLTKDEVVRSIGDAPPWSWFRLEEPRLVPLTDDSAVLAYRAVAQRTGAAEYRALMATTYVRREGRWLVALHQQTPLPD